MEWQVITNDDSTETATPRLEHTNPWYLTGPHSITLWFKPFLHQLQINVTVTHYKKVFMSQFNLIKMWKIKKIKQTLNHLTNKNRYSNWLSLKMLSRPWNQVKVTVQTRADKSYSLSSWESFKIDKKNKNKMHTHNYSYFVLPRNWEMHEFSPLNTNPPQTAS